MFNKILIANRGEIACRVIKTARRLGIKTVAVYSEIDAKALHVALADEAYLIGPAPPQQSYLNHPAIIDAALRSHAEAIHPGYGFLSENADFCRACVENDIVFIGPPISAIEAMGSKSQAKNIMATAGVPLIPGYQRADQFEATLEEQAKNIGYPVLIKASAGGGGKGMRLVENAKDFKTSLVSAKREAKQSFNNDEVILEKYIPRSRHIEVQVFCDQQGRGVYIGDRDCSLQRRHQKIIEEAPAPGLTAELRQHMGEAAVRAALSIDYCGAGTVEFLLDQQNQFYFMEMNTRLQVEHPVTEMVSGLDLVEWQLLVAAGGELPLTQQEIALRGHAIEARIYAEDCDNDFVPSSGNINYLRWPSISQVRVDTGVREGDSISTYYDPMIAKLITLGDDREQACRLLEQALAETKIAGLETNLPFLSRLQASKVFREVAMYTAYVDEEVESLLAPTTDDGNKNIALAAVSYYLSETAYSGGYSSPWNLKDAWRPNLSRQQGITLCHRDKKYSVNIEFEDSSQEENLLRVSIEGETFQFSAMLAGDYLTVNENNRREKFAVTRRANELTLFVGNRALQFSLWQFAGDSNKDTDVEHVVRAPMHGRLIELSVENGQTINMGDAVGIVEAMKMEHTLRAPFSGEVVQVYYQVNDTVENGAIVVELAPSA